MKKKKEKRENLKGSILINGKNIAKTSIKAYNEKDVKKKIPKQANTVRQYLKTVESQTSRGIAKALEMERASVTRTLFNLTQKKVVHVLKVAPCPITQKHVRWYALNKKPKDVVIHEAA
jgi:DNA invertase Pin-like site-specific DNA recombinase